jgi:CAAX protease family protein
MSMFTDGEGRLRPLWAFAFAAVLSCIAFYATGYLAAELAGDHVLRFEAIFRPLLAAVLLAIFSWLLTVGNFVETRRLAAQGLPLSPGWARQFGAGCVIGALLVIIGVITIAVCGNLALRSTINPHSIARGFLVVFVLLTGALAEELMFRGYPFQRLVEAIGATGAILAFSALFGLIHLWNPGASAWGLINTIAIGAVFSLAYLRTRALWLPWGFHFGWNFTMGLLLGLPVSGIRLFNVAVRATATGPKWLTGGSYGFEASVPGTIAVIVGLIVIWRVPVRPLVSPVLSLDSEQAMDTNPPDVAPQTHLPPETSL